MNEQSQPNHQKPCAQWSPGHWPIFQHPTLKHNLTTLKALHHVAWMDDTLHVELVMPFVWHSAFEELKSNVAPNCCASPERKLSTGNCRIT